MRKLVLALCLILLGSGVILAQKHTVIALGHADFSVNELDMATGKILQKFTALNQPHEAAISPDGKTIYASIPQAGHVVILGATMEEKGKIETSYFRERTPPPPGQRGGGGGQRGAAAGQRGAGQRGGQRGGEEGAPAPAAANQPPQPTGVSFPDSSSPHGMGLNTDGSKLYIGVEQADVPGVVVYDTRSNKVLKKIDLLLRGGHYLQVQPKTDKVYYPHRNDNRVVVIDGKTDTIKKIIDVPGGPVGVDFAPNGDVWIHGDGSGEVEGTVAVIDSRTDTLIRTIQTPGRGAGRMAVSPNGKWAASTHSGTQDVAIIDAERKELLVSVVIGGGPGFPMFSPDSSKLYVMVSSLSEVVTIDLNTMRVVNRWQAGRSTFGGGLRYVDGRR